MDLRIFSKKQDDIALYAPPGNFELSGKQFFVTFDSGEQITLAIPTDGGPRCVKVKDAIWLIVSQPPEPACAIILDLDAGLLTRATPATAGGFELSFGALEGVAAPHHEFSGILDGNTVDWTLGVTESSFIRASYQDGSVALTRPLAQDAPALTVTGFRAAKITDTLFLQTATVACDGEVVNVCLATDLHRVLCAGCIFGPADAVRMIGGHGRYPGEAYSGCKEGFFDLRTISPFNNVSIYQYTQPLCYELAGRNIKLIMDDGYDFELRFLDKDRLEWNRVWEPAAAARYECMKADDTTYLLSYELEGIRPRVHHTFVLDYENMLVTRIISTIGKNPRWPYLMTTEFEFGTIDDGREFKAYPRHGFTSDMIGNIVQWEYGSEMTTLHAYHCAHFYRLSHARDRVVSKEEAKENYAFVGYQWKLPSTDEPMVYIKIKDGMYLVSLIELYCEKLLGAEAGFRSNTLCFLQNYKRCYDVGLGFGTTTRPDGTDSETNSMICAYGRVIAAKDKELKRLLKDPNPFII